MDYSNHTLTAYTHRFLLTLGLCLVFLGAVVFAFGQLPAHHAISTQFSPTMILTGFAIVFAAINASTIFAADFVSRSAQSAHSTPTER